MGFEDLEQYLKNFFHFCHKTDRDVAQRVRLRAMEAFALHTAGRPGFFQTIFQLIFARKYASLTFSGVAALVMFSVFWEGGTISAGTLQPTFGPVEIIRDGSRRLVRGEISLRVGDEVHVGNRAEAQILLPNKLASTVKDHTRIAIVDDESLFLEMGMIESEAFHGAAVATERGMIESSPGAKFSVSVAESGQSTITLQKNWVHVSDITGKKRLVLNAGEELVLRTDTVLADAPMVPEDLQLSGTQIRAIEAKLAIARSKILRGVDYLLAGRKSLAHTDLLSAEKTFRSIAQVLHSTRHLEIIKRKSLEGIAIFDIVPFLADKSASGAILGEAKALEQLFVILREKGKHLAFAPLKTGVSSFDRYALLKQVFALGAETQQEFAVPLLDKYVVMFLRNIQNEELRMDQISILNTEIEKLPNTDLARAFLEKAQERFSPDISIILEEKIERYF